jgi:poly(3-hydroxybutyrate) depolymerase
MRKKIIKSLNVILAFVTAISMVFITPNNVLGAEQTSSINQSSLKTMSSALKDATYVGVTDADNDLISYRLQVTIKGGKITKASFYMCFDGCEYTSGTTDYLLNNQWMGMRNSTRRARYESMDNTFNDNAIAARSYNEKLIDLSNPSELTEPSTNKEVYVALKAAWKNIMEDQVSVVEHRGESLGDNNNVPHSWNEYIPKYVQDHSYAKVPMVMTLHAAGNNIEQAEGLGFTYVGAKANFITVIPSATVPGFWSEQYSKLSPYNDEEFLLKLINNIENNYPIDKQKIYMSGISLGATMTADMGILHPEIFAGIDIVAGGPSLNVDIASNIQKRLSQGLTRLPIIYGVGTDDVINFKKENNDSKLLIRAEYDPLLNTFKKMNNIPVTDFDDNYIFGAPLKNSQTFNKYGYEINTGAWYSNDNLENADYMMMCTINEMWHSNPNPHYAKISWDYLNKYSRKADGTLIQDNHVK